MYRFYNYTPARKTIQRAVYDFRTALAELTAEYGGKTILQAQKVNGHQKQESEEKHL